MVTYRVLPPAEWARLSTTPMAQGKMPEPDSSIVIVAEEDDQVIGTWACGPVLMLDGLWVAEEHRHTMTPLRLFQATMQTLEQLQVKQVITLASTPAVEALGTRLGFTSHPGTLMMAHPVKDL